MKRYGAIFVAAAVLSFAAPVLAQETAERSVSMMEALPELNRIKPLQNQRFLKSSQVLDRSVIDRTAYIVGKVDDLILSHDGKPSYLSVSFDRLRLQEPVLLSFDATKIAVVSNGYKVGYKGSEIQANYAELLSDIESAAGDTSAVSMRSVLGKSVVA